jgi:hypothetical protein
LQHENDNTYKKHNFFLVTPSQIRHSHICHASSVPIMQTPEWRRCLAGFSLCETVIAMAIGVIAISGAAALNSQQLRIVADTRQASAASHALQERLEQVRSVNWKQVIDATYLTGTFLAAPPKSVAPLADYQENITITGWPAGGGTVLRITKEPKLAAQVVAQSGDLANERLLKIVVQLKWEGTAGIVHTRELATILSNGGISRVNLPAMGPIGGGAWDAATDVSPISTGGGGDDTTTSGTTDGTANSGNSGGNSSGEGDGSLKGNGNTNGSGDSGNSGSSVNAGGNGGTDNAGSGKSDSGGRGNVGGASGTK